MRQAVRVVVLAAIAVEVAAAQVRPGSIAGRVTDSDGGVIPGVTVTVTCGQIKRAVVSDRAGRFVFSDLPPGTCRAVVSLTGFLSTAEDLGVVSGQTTEWVAPLVTFSTPSRATPEISDPTDPTLARGVYAAVIDLVFTRGLPDRLVVEAESVVPRLLIAEDWTDAHALLRLRIEFGTSSYQAFSRVFAPADGLDALVEYRHHCGNLCGEGALLWFGRSSKDAPWVLRGRGFFWVS